MITNEHTELKRVKSVAQQHYPTKGSHWWSHIQETINTFWHIFLNNNLILDPYLQLSAIMYHDASIMSHGRDNHEITSATIFEQDVEDYQLDFNKEQIKLIKEAIEDHRYSKQQQRIETYGKCYRSIYGEILAACDKGYPKTTIEALCKRAILHHFEEHEATLHEVTYAAGIITIADKIASVVQEHVSHKYVDQHTNCSKYYLKVFGEELKKQEKLAAHLTKEQVLDIIKRDYLPLYVNKELLTSNSLSW